VRASRSKAKGKLFHIPLDLSLQAVRRKHGPFLRRNHPTHLHYFTKGTALPPMTDVGYKIVCFAVCPDLTGRVLGGYSLIVRAE
jgi:hypothetical protein